jgi:hypothetical protein
MIYIYILLIIIENNTLIRVILKEDLCLYFLFNLI